MLSLVQSGNIDEAEHLAETLCSQRPDMAEIWYIRAGLHAGRGHVADVIGCCKRVISLDPGHTGAHHNLAIAFCQTGQLREAEGSYRECLSVDPGNQPALLGIGKLLASGGRHAEALSYFTKAVEGNPSNAEALYRQGVTLQSLGDLGGAKNAYRQAVKVRPDYFEALNNLGHILGEQGEYEESLRLFKTLALMKPDSAEVRNNLGVVYESMGKLVEAEAAYRKTLELEPSFLETRNHLGFLLAGEGRTAEALECFQEVRELEPGNETALAGQTGVLEKMGRIDDAYSAIEPAIQAGSVSPDVVLAYCKIMLRKGDPQTAIPVAEKVLANGQLPPKGIADMNFALGDLYDKVGDYAAAFPHFEAANTASPCTYKHESHVQYIDRIIQSTTAETISSTENDAGSSGQLIFILGMPRSGTSLVEQILSSHPDVFGAGELNFMGDIASSSPLPGNPGIHYPDFMGKLERSDISAMARRYLESMAAVTDGSPAVTDKMPHNYLYMGLITLLFPAAKIIHISRSPLDNCLSLYFHSFNAMHSYSTDLRLLGEYYKEYLRLMSHWRALPGLRFLDIRYEDIVDNLEKCTRELLDYCALDWSEECLDFHNSGRFVKTPSYDQVRRPIYTSSVGRWRHYRDFIAPLEAALGREQ